MHGHPGISVKAPLCQTHAGLVVKPLQKQDVKMEMKTMLECVGWGADPWERKLSPARTASLQHLGVAEEAGGCWGSLAEVGWMARAFPSRQADHLL